LLMMRGFMAYRFNPPPGWPPAPPGWSPPSGWQPDPDWPPPPPGWQLWLPDSDSTAPQPPSPPDDRPSWAPQPSGGQPRPSLSRSRLPALQPVWARFRRLPAWAKILLVLLLVALLPVLLIVAGLAAAALGSMALVRGPLPRFGITSKATAGLALVLGLASVGAGSAWIAAASSPSAPAQLDQPTVAIPTSAPAIPAPPTTTPTATTTRAAPTTTHPPASRPTPQKTTVPKVVGTAARTATTVLAKHGLRWTITYKSTGRFAAGTVISQSQAAGTAVQPRTVIALVVAKPPPPLPPPAPSAPSNCDPAYPDVCLQDGIGDYDCAGGSGDGPNYVTRPIKVLPPDPFRLDYDHDGIGCESS
jgi:hypothetical protein